MTHYRNPVIDHDFPDPSPLRASDGYYAYSSQHTTTERWAHVPVARSVNLIDWQLLGDAMPERPAWSAKRWEFAWAPHVVEHGGRYVMFYSAMPDTATGMCIGVATAPHPRGPFVDIGQPIAGGPGFITIDPMAFHDPVSGGWFLYWGGDYAPIYVQELEASLLRMVAGTTPLEVLYPDTGAPYERLVEGAFLHYRDGWYYLFYSGDDFGGDPPNYAVLVARSRTPRGPFEKLASATGRASSAIVARSEHWDAPGHASLIVDQAGAEWLVYHAIDPRRRWQATVRFVRRPMLIDRLDWVDGWPRVATGSPSFRRRPGPMLEKLKRH